MIITRSPLRLSLGGGGTDLPSYYQRHGGFLVAAAIDKYVYMCLHHTFQPEIILKYSKMERHQDAIQIEHPIFREALLSLGLSAPSLELTSLADVPAGTGLGSSGSFTTALLKALHAYKKNLISPAQLASDACEIEIGRLKQPIGKQDQYIAAFGGLTAFQFLENGQVEARSLRVSDETLHNLEDNLVMFYTGISRSASAILEDQDKRTKSEDPSIIEQLHSSKEVGLQTLQALESGDLEKFAKLMDAHWRRKQNRSQGISNSTINDCYQYAMENGALGGKLLGAGGGGFLMFYAHDKIRLRHALLSKGMRELRFRFDFEGTKVLIQ